jgi:hypothetical protein
MVGYSKGGPGRGLGWGRFNDLATVVLVVVHEGTSPSIKPYSVDLWKCVLAVKYHPIISNPLLNITDLAAHYDR